MLQLYPHRLALIKTWSGCRQIDVLFYVGVSRKALLIFVVYVAETPPGQQAFVKKSCRLIRINIYLKTS